MLRRIAALAVMALAIPCLASADPCADRATDCSGVGSGSMSSCGDGTCCPTPSQAAGLCSYYPACNADGSCCPLKTKRCLVNESGCCAQSDLTKRACKRLCARAVLRCKLDCTTRKCRKACSGTRRRGQKECLSSGYCPLGTDVTTTTTTTTSTTTTTTTPPFDGTWTGTFCAVACGDVTLQIAADGSATLALALLADQPFTGTMSEGGFLNVSITFPEEQCVVVAKGQLQLEAGRLSGNLQVLGCGSSGSGLLDVQMGGG